MAVSPQVVAVITQLTEAPIRDQATAVTMLTALLSQPAWQQEGAQLLQVLTGLLTQPTVLATSTSLAWCALAARAMLGASTQVPADAAHYSLTVTLEAVAQSAALLQQRVRAVGTLAGPERAAACAAWDESEDGKKLAALVAAASGTLKGLAAVARPGVMGLPSQTHPRAMLQRLFDPGRLSPTLLRTIFGTEDAHAARVHAATIGNLAAMRACGMQLDMCRGAWERVVLPVPAEGAPPEDAALPSYIALMASATKSLLGAAPAAPNLAAAAAPVAAAGGGAGSGSSVPVAVLTAGPATMHAAPTNPALAASAPVSPRDLEADGAEE